MALFREMVVVSRTVASTISILAANGRFSMVPMTAMGTESPIDGTSKKLKRPSKRKGGLRPLSACLCFCQAAFGGQSKFGNDFSEAWRSASE